MSWKVEVEAPNEVWSSNAIRFATEAEAKAAGDELLSRWMAPISSRATETPNEPGTHRFDFEEGRSERLNP